MNGWFAYTIVGPSLVWLAGVLLWLIRGNSSSAKADHKTASAIVVARNEELTISDCLYALTGQSIPFESVHLYDDASTDRTREVAERIANETQGIRIHTVPQEGGSISPKKRAFAAAFQSSTADILALTDADCLVPVHWADVMSSQVEDTTGAVIGASWPEQKTTVRDRFYRWERLTANSLMASACGWGSPASACGHNIFYSSKVLRKIEAPVYRDMPSGDDDLTVQTVARAGWRVKFSAHPDSVVTDLGGLRGSRWQQAVRHQSVSHLYPWYWRLLFALSILANVAALGFILSLPFVATSFTLYALLAKLFTDTMTGALLANKLRLNINIIEVLIASLVLPVWAFWRALAGIFGRRFEWRGRKLTTTKTAVPSASIHGF